jgi:hypothetical protein
VPGSVSGLTALWSRNWCRVARNFRDQVTALREYVMAEAGRSAAERENERLIPEDIAEAVLPTARALLLRKVLESSSDQRRARAFAALTAPYADILPPGP